MTLLKTTTLVLAMLVSAGLSACESKGPAQKAGERIDDAAEKTRDSLRDAADTVRDKVEEACDKVTGKNC